MEKKEIIWTIPAKIDLWNIFDFLSDVSELVALNVIKRILSTTARLEFGYVKIGQVEPLLEDRKQNHRYLVEGYYKIIYREEKNSIIINSVFDTRQNPDKLKLIQ